MRKPQAPKIKSSKAEKNKMPPRSLTRTMPRNLIPALWALVFHGQDIFNAVLYLLRQIAFAYDKEKPAKEEPVSLKDATETETETGAGTSDSAAKQKKSVYVRRPDHLLKPELLAAFTIARNAFNAEIPAVNALRQAAHDKAVQEEEAERALAKEKNIPREDKEIAVSKHRGGGSLCFQKAQRKMDESRKQCSVF